MSKPKPSKAKTTGPAATKPTSLRRAKPGATATRAQREQAMRERLARGDLPPLPDKTRLALICHAIEKWKVGDQPGQRSTAYNLPVTALFGIAASVIGDGKPSDLIAREWKREIDAAGSSVQAVIRWLGQVKQIYCELHYDSIKQLISAEDSLQFHGDNQAMIRKLLTEVTLLMLRIMPQFEESDTAGRHTILRMAEVCALLAETLAKIDHREAQTDKLRQAIERAAREISSRQQGGAMMSVDQMRDIIAQAAGLEPEQAETPKARSKTAGGAA